MVWYTSGEEENVFPALEKVAPKLAGSYQRDQRGLDSLYESLKRIVDDSDTLVITLATTDFHFFLGLHLNKEEAYLHCIYRERKSLPGQAVIIGKMSQQIPPERFLEEITWLYPLLGSNDYENMTRIWEQALPKSVFAVAHNPYGKRSETTRWT